MTTLIYLPQRLTPPRSGSLSLDAIHNNRRVRLTLKPGQNKVDDPIWESIKKRPDVRDLIQHDKAIKEVIPPTSEEQATDKRAERLLELQTSDWRVLRGLAESYGITKEDSESWDSKISNILEAEGLG